MLSIPNSHSENESEEKSNFWLVTEPARAHLLEYESFLRNGSVTLSQRSRACGLSLEQRLWPQTTENNAEEKLLLYGQRAFSVNPQLWFSTKAGDTAVCNLNFIPNVNLVYLSIPEAKFYRACFVSDSNIGDIDLVAETGYN